VSGYGSYFPVGLRVDGRRVVVIGGDGEAAIKVEKLLAARADLTVISASVVPALEKRAAQGEIRLVRRDYRRGDLAKAFAAFLCESRFAAVVRAEANRRRVLLNVLDRSELCDFIAAAYFVRDGLQIAVHSSGKSAALARRIREELEERYGEPFAELARTLGELRSDVKHMIPSRETRHDFWLETVDAALVKRVASGSFDRRDFRILVMAKASAFAHTGGESRNESSVH
jgi:precorrin-2 dehydrogenase / sirohydrochlorin ferrochelatase